MPPATTVTIPNIELSLEQLITAIRQLEPDARSAVAKALVDTELDERMAELIKNLANRTPANDITGVDIVAEVNAVR